MSSIDRMYSNMSAAELSNIILKGKGKNFFSFLLFKKNTENILRNKSLMSDLKKIQKNFLKYFLVFFTQNIYHKVSHIFIVMLNEKNCKVIFRVFLQSCQSPIVRTHLTR